MRLEKLVRMDKPERNSKNGKENVAARNFIATYLMLFPEMIDRSDNLVVGWLFTS